MKTQSSPSNFGGAVNRMSAVFGRKIYIQAPIVNWDEILPSQSLTVAGLVTANDKTCLF